MLGTGHLRPIKGEGDAAQQSVRSKLGRWRGHGPSVSQAPPSRVTLATASDPREGVIQGGHPPAPRRFAWGQEVLATEARRTGSEKKTRKRAQNRIESSHSVFI